MLRAWWAPRCAAHIHLSDRSSDLVWGCRPYQVAGLHCRCSSKGLRARGPTYLSLPWPAGHPSHHHRLQEVSDQYAAFLRYALTLPDVWVVTIQEVSCGSRGDRLMVWHVYHGASRCFTLSPGPFQPLWPSLQVLRWMADPVPADEYSLYCPTPTDMVFPGGRFCLSPTGGCIQVPRKDWWWRAAGGRTAWKCCSMECAAQHTLPRQYGLLNHAATPCHCRAPGAPSSVPAPA